MKIRLEETDEQIGKHNVEIETDVVTIVDVLSEIRNALIAYGFHPDSVKRAFIELAEDFKREE